MFIKLHRLSASSQSISLDSLVFHNGNGEMNAFDQAALRSTGAAVREGCLLSPRSVSWRSPPNHQLRLPKLDVFQYKSWWKSASPRKFQEHHRIQSHLWDALEPHIQQKTDSRINDMASYVHMCHGEKLDCVLAIVLDSHQFMFIGFNRYLIVFMYPIIVRSLMMGWVAINHIYIYYVLIMAHTHTDSQTHQTKLMKEHVAWDHEDSGSDFFRTMSQHQQQKHKHGPTTD